MTVRPKRSGAGFVSRPLPGVAPSSEGEEDWSGQVDTEAWSSAGYLVTTPCSGHGGGGRLLNDEPQPCFHSTSIPVIPKLL